MLLRRTEEMAVEVSKAHVFVYKDLLILAESLQAHQVLVMESAQQ